MYIYERKEWPDFQWDQAGMVDLLVEVRHMQGRLLGRMEELGFQLRGEATLQTLTLDVVKTSEIEGEKLDAEQVRSSIARRLGMDIGALPQIDRNVEGIVEMMLDATGKFDAPLTQERLFGWYAALFPTGRTGMHRITVGGWRTDATGKMQVVSGPIGREKIHYEAPGFDRLDAEMSRFIHWCNAASETDPVIKSALLHFWFVTIHPFDDGNGRIARAIADMMLARSERSSQRFYSMSSQIQRGRNAYYEVLEKCQKGTLDITPWVVWFLNCLKRAIGVSEQTLKAVLIKARFWKAHAGESLNDRQRKVINRLLDGFEGKLTSSKWAKLTKCSQDTALRDIGDLLNRQILSKDEAGGRSSSYQLCLPTSAA
ncbi:MAG TPA: Fic family protein [Verrucomicrobiae bacterium]|jgi:Fic family protein|nr:Fic family protein [Verrucomicrobiae bacterium]